MPSFNKVRNDVDGLISQYWPEIQTRETNYVATWGSQFQGLWTHAAPPRHSQQVDGSKTPDNLISPTDLLHTWIDFYTALTVTSLPCRFKLDVYEAPGGRGYVLTVQFEYDNGDGTIDKWQKAVQNGPETHRAHDWKVIVI